jgi:hypothetical protein
VAFLDWERRQPAKYEFDGVRPVAMTGGTAAHAATQRNLIGVLYNDRIDKNQEYRDTPSIQRYVEQTKIAATVFHRNGDDWVGHLQIGETVLNLPEIETRDRRESPIPSLPTHPLRSALRRPLRLPSPSQRTTFFVPWYSTTASARSWSGMRARAAVSILRPTFHPTPQVTGHDRRAPVLSNR